MEFTPSPHQKRIFDFIENGTGSAAVTAVAGAGKTTTIVEALRLIHPRDSVIFIAFSKLIADELKRRVPDHVRASTFNSVGAGAIYAKTDGKSDLQRGKCRTLLKEGVREKRADGVRTFLSEEEYNLYGTFVLRLVELAKSAGVDTPLLPDTEKSYFDLIDHFELDLPEKSDPERAVALTREVLRRSNEVWRKVHDFSDQLYIPVREGLRLRPYRWVFVDEAQDTNAIQQVMLERLVANNGRLIMVGDPKQAIYGFRGADAVAMDRLSNHFRCTRLPLTVSYRCPREVVRAAREFVPYIEPSPTAADGTVQALASYDKNLFRPQDAVVCRNTAPLVDLAFRLLRLGVGCRILGKDIGAGLVALIEQMHTSKWDELQDRLIAYRDREVRKLQEKDEEEKAQGVQDRVDSLLAMMAHHPENERHVQSLIGRISSMFKAPEEGGHLLTLCTVHKAKGLEWNRVFILDRFELMPARHARNEWQQEQERNLIYVAYTRSKSELYFISSKGMRDAGPARLLKSASAPVEDSPTTARYMGDEGCDTAHPSAHEAPVETSEGKVGDLPEKGDCLINETSVPESMSLNSGDEREEDMQTQVKAPSFTFGIVYNHGAGRIQVFSLRPGDGDKFSAEHKGDDLEAWIVNGEDDLPYIQGAVLLQLHNMAFPSAPMKRLDSKGVVAKKLWPALRGVAKPFGQEVAPPLIVDGGEPVTEQDDEPIVTEEETQMSDETKNTATETQTAKPAEAKAPKAKKTKKTKTESDASKTGPRTKGEKSYQNLLREILGSGQAYTIGELAAKLNADERNTSVAISILRNAKRTKDPLNVVYDKNTKKYSKGPDKVAEAAPAAEASAATAG